MATADTLARREELLLGTLADLVPDVLITELFPFGRRILRAEFTALLQAGTALTNPPVVLSSIRDILAPPSKPAKRTFAEETLARCYDGVLVHADPNVTPLDLSWPVSHRIAGLLRYTGFVCPPPAVPHPEKVGAGEIIVSAGGGDVGETLFAAAAEAAGLDPTRRWRLLVGGAQADTRCQALMADAPANVIAEPARSDFRQMLHHAAVSVSLCGYNTALDVLQTACPAVFVPFDAGGEVEQRIRADALAAQPGIETLLSGALTGQTLLARVTQAQSVAREPLGTEITQGAARTVEIVAHMVEAVGGH